MARKPVSADTVTDQLQDVIRARFVANIESETEPEGVTVREVASAAAAPYADAAEAAAAAAEAAVASIPDELDTEDGAIAALVSTPSSTADAIAGTARTFTATQTFDPDEGFQVGPDLKLVYTNGFFGQRLHLTGTSPGIMPYLEIAPTSTVSTDVGKRLAGLQVYKTVGGGGAPNREFLAIESQADDGTLPGYVFASFSSGSGVTLPVRFMMSSWEVFRMNSDGYLQLGVNSRIFSDNPGSSSPLILFRREGALGVLQARVHADGASDYPRIHMARNRGTIAASTAPLNADVLGFIGIGAMNGTTEAPGAGFRVDATEDWNLGSARGAKMIVRAAPVGSSAMQTIAEFMDPAATRDTGILLRVNRGGTRTVNLVTIGDPDSGGTGYRLLRVVN